MTDIETQAIEREAIQRIKCQPDWSTDGNDLLRLVTEVRRLREVIKSARSSYSFDEGDGYMCTMSQCAWCEVDGDRPHRDDCPAFTPDGQVR